MDKKIIKKEYDSKVKLLIKYDKFYYENSDPKVSDKEYDDLKKEILKLEKKYPDLKSDYSPSKKVGHKPSKNFKKDFHRVPMLSLANAFTENDLINFEKKINNYLSKSDSYKI